MKRALDQNGILRSVIYLQENCPDILTIDIAIKRNSAKSGKYIKARIGTQLTCGAGIKDYNFDLFAPCGIL